jgi:hypothetical protein
MGPDLLHSLVPALCAVLRAVLCCALQCCHQGGHGSTSRTVHQHTEGERRQTASHNSTALVIRDGTAQHANT